MKSEIKNQIKNRMKKRAEALTICALIGGFACGCSVSDGNVTTDVSMVPEAGMTAEGDTVPEVGTIAERDTVPETGMIADRGEIADAGAAEDTGTQGQAFSKALFAQSLKETNPIESPLSAYLAMALAGEGAKGDTAAEFDAVMGKDRRALSEQFMKSFPAQTEGTKVALANSAWVDDRMTCEADWLAAAADNYLAEVYQQILSSGETLTEINSWVERNTQGLIKDLLDQPLDDMTRMALFNTIYFKGQWQNAFESKSTKKEDFTLADGTQTQVDMMRRTGKMDYVQGEEGTEKLVQFIEGFRDLKLWHVQFRSRVSPSCRNAFS